jgi:hypothetical protein
VGDWEEAHPHSLVVVEPNPFTLLFLKFYQDSDLFPEIANGFIEVQINTPSQTYHERNAEFLSHGRRIVTNPPSFGQILSSEDPLTPCFQKAYVQILFTPYGICQIRIDILQGPVQRPVFPIFPSGLEHRYADLEIAESRRGRLLGIPAKYVPVVMGDDIRQSWVHNNYAMEGTMDPFVEVST